MSLIQRIELSRHSFPLPTPFPPAWDSRPRRNFEAVLVKVYDSEGRCGIGSGDAMHGFADYAHLFLGRRADTLERHASVLENISFHSGRCWPLDMALWDLAGKREGQPVHRLMGGRSDKIRLYASSGVHREPDRMVEQAHRYAELGFPAMKMRLNPDSWRSDLATLRLIRDRVGSKLELMVDCNQGWRMPWDTRAPWSLETALHVAESLHEVEAFWMEEPLHRSDLEGMRSLKASGKVRIAGAEMTRELRQLENLLHGDCVDVLQPDVVLCGGFLGLKKLARLAEQKGVLFTPHTWGNGLGLLANAHLTAGAAAAPFLEYPFDPPEWTPKGRDFMLATPLEPDDQGWLRLSQEPGFGIVLDEETLTSTRVHSDSFT